MDGLFKFLSLALQPTKFYYLFMHDTYSKIAFYIMEVTKVGWEYTPRGGQLLGNILGDCSAITIYLIDFISIVSVLKKNVSCCLIHFKYRYVLYELRIVLVIAFITNKSLSDKSRLISPCRKLSF